MARPRTYKKELDKALKSPREAVEYLNAALGDGKLEVFLLALRDVVEARLGGVGNLAQLTGLSRVNLYRMLSKNGSPALTSLLTLLETLGFRLSVEWNKKPSKTTARRMKKL